LPPIHQIGVELKLNFYGHSTLKPNETIFKKTIGKFDKKKDENYILVGKKI
jgi:hypothetical protein